jgi:hypothetical protein
MEPGISASVTYVARNSDHKTTEAAHISLILRVISFAKLTLYKLIYFYGCVRRMHYLYPSTPLPSGTRTKPAKHQPWAYSSTLKITVINSSGTSVSGYRSSWRNVPEDTITHSCRRRNVRFPSCLFCTTMAQHFDATSR